MYVNPFLAGIMFTIIAELIGLLVWAYVDSKKKKK